MKFWKNYTTEDVIVVITEKAAKAVKPQIINFCWRKLCPEVVYDFTGFKTDPIKDIIKEIMDMVGKKR